MQKIDSITIVVPVLNEASNIEELVKRIHEVLYQKYRYEIIVVDDHSTDETAEIVKRLQNDFPIQYYLKLGIVGKAQSLLEGFSYAKYGTICMIDSDLQYPPEALPGMIQKMDEGSDVIIATRREAYTPFARKLTSKIFNTVFCKFLHGIDQDVQSGLKTFRKEIIERVKLRPMPWTFDLEFLIAAKSAGYTIDAVDVIFEKRKGGASKIDIVSASIQIGLSALLLKLAPKPVVPFHKEKSEYSHFGFTLNAVDFIHFSDVGLGESAVRTLLLHQKLFIISFFSLLVGGLFINWIFTLTLLIGVVTVIYFADLLFNLYLIFRSFSREPELKVSQQQIDAHPVWPIYTILCPLYREWRVIPQFAAAIDQLDYPKDKLEVMLLLEKDDTETLAYVKKMQLPAYMRAIVVPDTLPKTKPKACNYGLRQASGKYIVIYDAEDMPDPLQLKKSVIAFENSPNTTACIQAKLNYYNTDQNLLTRLFTAEYSLWFNLILTGLQSLYAPIPLGGTSNHFRTDSLREVKGWDSFNVTEDCDLGIRLAKRGYNTAIIDSVTLEEANSDLGNWFNQRSRWIKGYMQTYLVHMRNPAELLTPAFREHFFTFQLVVGGKILSLFINPFMWIVTIVYFSFRAAIGPSIEKFFPGFIFYLGAVALIIGNFLYLYYYMIACVKNKQYSLVKFVFFIPLYWIAMSIAAWKGLIQLILRPHYWPKTIHGLHLKQEELPVVEKTPIEGLNVFKKYNALLYAFISKFKQRKAERSLIGNITFVSAMMFANIVNFLFTFYLGNDLGYRDFGLLTLVNTLSFLITIAFSALTASISHRIAFLTGSAAEATEPFFNSVRRKTILRTAIIALFWLAFSPLIARFFYLTSIWPVLTLIIVMMLGVVNALNEGYLIGNLRFISLSAVFLAAPIARLASGIALHVTNNNNLIFLTIPISFIAPCIVSSLMVYVKRKNIKVRSVSADLTTFPLSFYFSSLFSAFSVSAYITIDILLVQHYLPAVAGIYSLLSMAGKTIFFFGGLLDRFIIPYVSRDIGSHKSPERRFYSMFIITCLLTSWAFVFTGMFGPTIGAYILPEKIGMIAPYLFLYSFAIANITIGNTLLKYHLARHHYSFPLFALLSTSIMFAGISWYHYSLWQITWVLFITSCINITGMVILHIIQRNGHFLVKNIVDFVCLFLPEPKGFALKKNRKNILIYNWRDLKHRYAGGAEVYIHELAKRWVKMGYQVVIFCGNDGLTVRNEVIDGVRIVRRGGFYMVYVWAFLYYILKFRGQFDVIIDCENGIPFFTPLFAREKIYLLIHHIHQDVFRTSLSTPIAVVATFLEIKVMPFIYKNINIITVSSSSKKEIINSKISNEKPYIIHNGVDLKSYLPGKKTDYPLIIYIGRLKKYKSLPVFIRAAKQVAEVVPKARFVIAGDGEESIKLKHLVNKLGLEGKIEFTGRISEEKKIKLYQEAWMFVHPSFMEGWSLTTIEANACGTPVIASDVPGLCDSVQHNVSGILVEYGNVKAFSNAIISLITNRKKRAALSQEAIIWAKRFDWQKSAEAAVKFMELDC